MNLNNSGKRSLVCSEIFFALFLTFGLLVLFLPACGSTTESRQPIAEITTQTTGPLDEHRRLNTATATLIPTPTPTPLPRPAAFDEAFARGLIRFDPESGQWIVSAYQTVDSGRETVELILLPDTFDTHDDLRAKNPLAPYTVRALDENGQPVTLIWRPDAAEFRLAPTFQELYTGVNTDSPRLNEEALASLPTFTIEDIQSGLAVQSLLAHILDRMASGESLADILYMDPDAVRQNWQKLGGNSLLFELLPDGKVAWLKAKGNDQSAKELRYDNMTMKILPLVANLEVNGANYSAFYMANFDPIDPQNPDPEDLSNWKFFLSIPFNQNVLWEKSFSAKAPLVPYILLYGDEKYQQNHPLLAQLLSIEGNDATGISGYEYSDTVINISLAITHYSSLLKTEGYGDVIEMPIPPNLILPSELQYMLFLFEVGVAQ